MAIQWRRWEDINKVKSLESLVIYKPLMSIKGKRVKIKIAQVKNEKGALTTDRIDIRRIKKEHYKKFPIDRCERLV